jgi:hypothetical protein
MVSTEPWHKRCGSVYLGAVCCVESGVLVVCDYLCVTTVQQGIAVTE